MNKSFSKAIMVRTKLRNIFLKNDNPVDTTVNLPKNYNKVVFFFHLVNMEPY